MLLRIKNWEEFQHYKHRNPPWIKLHKKLLDDRSFQCMQDASRALAPCLWLLASESKDGIFDGSTRELSFRLRQTEKWIESALNPLISSGLIIVVQDASKALADCEHDASNSLSETETETETETEITTAASEKISLSPEGTWLGLQDAQITVWKKAYPAVLLDAELSAAAAWIVANPKNKKSNYARFLTNWLKRQQDRAPRMPQADQQRRVAL